MYFSGSQIKAMDQRYRANFINSLSGYKSANLIGTRSQDGIENLAIFSSVIHLGSHPPLLGFILRPTSAIRNTWDNLNSTGVFSVNHVNQSIYQQAHHTSARYSGEVSEFEKSGLTPVYKNDFEAPFVAEAPVQIACKMQNHYFIEENKCRLIVGEILGVTTETSPAEDGFLGLAQQDTVCINGLDAYALPQLLDRLAYAKPDVPTKSIYE